MKLIRIVICIGFTFISGFIYAQSTDVDTEEVSQFDFANGLYSRQFFKEAIEEYKKFIANYPNSPRLGEAYLRLGKSALVEKQYEVAISAFDQAISRLSDLKRKTEAILGKG
ncbi:MAG: tetratricopeptide repeat protein, partial [Candidatus Hydrogenedens sp.]|nr:tetratricopeptide repeat protein [Candidatus Hydrogenedens sp.]